MLRNSPVIVLVPAKAAAASQLAMSATAKMRAIFMLFRLMQSFSHDSNVHASVARRETLARVVASNAGTA